MDSGVNKKITVIGAGVIGLSCAWQLARAGFKVKIIHADAIGTGASANAAGALKPFDALQTGRKQQLQIESLWRYPTFLNDLKEDSGIEVQMNRCGRFAVFHKEKGWQKTIEAAKKANTEWPQHCPISPAQSILPPEALNLPEEAAGIMHCHVTATFSPAELLAALYQACLKCGITFEQKKLDTLPADRPLVVAAGAFSGTFSSQGVRPIKRQAILLEWPEAEPLKHIIENGQVYLIPWEEGRSVYVGSTFEPEAKFDTTPTRKAEAHLRAHAARLVPSLEHAPLLERFSGVQSRGIVTANGQSTLILGEDTTQKGVFVATGHGGVGFCMAPITAHIICEKIKAYLTV